MTRDIDHLKWIYERMVNVHNEHENLDYMLRFKKILDNFEEGKESK